MNAKRAFTLLELLVVIAIIGLLMALLMPALQSVRESARRSHCGSRLKQIGTALHAYHGSIGTLPFGWNGVEDNEGFEMRWSFLAAILPFLEEDNVYADLNLERNLYPRLPGGGHPPQAEHTTTIRTVITTYLCPSDTGRLVSGPTGVIDSAPTNYLACSGSGINAPDDPGDDGAMDARADGPFGSHRVYRFANILDGLGTTALVSESLLGAGGADPPASESPDRRRYMALVAGSFPNFAASVTTENCDQERPSSIARFVASRGRIWAGQGYENTMYNHLFPPNADRYDCFFWVDRGFKAARSRHPGGVNVLLGDGGVRLVGDGIDRPIWRGIATREAGEPVSF